METNYTTTGLPAIKQSQTIVAFHIGRGGYFNNPGHLSFIGEEKIGHFTDDLFTKFENQDDFKERFGYDNTGSKYVKCILDLLTEKDFDALEKLYGITESMLGEEIYVDGGGNPVGLTASEEATGIGCIDKDGDYDTTYTEYLHELSEGQVNLILDSRLCNRYLLEELEELGLIEEIEEVEEEEEETE